MKIGIVGTGNVGATLARQLASLGNDIGAAKSRGPETLTKLVEQTGTTPAATDTANQKQVVILRSREGSSPSHPKPSRARRYATSRCGPGGLRVSLLAPRSEASFHSVA